MHHRAVFPPAHCRESDAKNLINPLLLKMHVILSPKYKKSKNLFNLKISANGRIIWKITFRNFVLVMIALIAYQKFSDGDMQRS